MARSRTTTGKTPAAKTTAAKTTANKTTANKTKTAAEPVAKGSIPVPGIKPAAVVAPVMAVAAAMPELAAANEKSTEATPVMLKKQELVERIGKATGAKKKDVKLLLEATLGVLGDALSAGEELNLPPLGKIKVNRQRQDGNIEVLILRLRRGGGDAKALAEAAEDDSVDD